ncbi:MAG: dihydroorotate dehydrogenase electron transfer subunit [Clostridia bacterium]
MDKITVLKDTNTNENTTNLKCNSVDNENATALKCNSVDKENATKVKNNSVDNVVTVLKNERIANDIYQMLLQHTAQVDIKGGQFIHIKLSAEFSLRRPFCICNFDKKAKTITITYQIVGKGTAYLATVKAGEKLSALFPLGNGFTIEDTQQKVLLISGGIGNAVLPAITAEYPNKDFYTFMGFANAGKVCLTAEMQKVSKQVVISTDDGSYGFKGFVTQAVAQQFDAIKPDVVLCCGPEIMFKSVAKTLQNKNTPIYVSLERRMGCGVGACLVCACKVKTADGAKYLHACIDGPVFDLREVCLDE